MIRQEPLPARAHTVRFGMALRHARNAAGLTLGDVERLTQGEIKASVLSAHERGTRAIPEARLAVLAALYGLEPRQLIARAAVPAPRTRSVVIDLRALESSRNIALQRLVRDVLEWRGQSADGVLTIRRADLGSVTVGATIDVVEEQLRVEGVIVDPAPDA